MELISNSTAAKLTAAGKILPGLLVALFFTFIGIGEWCRVGVVANPNDIAHYPFSSEGPVAGVWYYQKPELYASHSLVTALLMVPALVGLVIAVRRRTTASIVVAYGLILLGIIAISVISNIAPE
jgi:hypothetical protein